MKRPHYHPSRCKTCGREGTVEDRISQTGKCGVCARALLESNIDQMRYRSGPNFTRWRRAMAASVGGVLLDDVTDSP